MTNFLHKINISYVAVFLQECSDNGLGTFNNVVTVTQRDLDVYFETQELTSPEKGV